MKKMKTLFVCILYVLLFLTVNFGMITIFTLGFNLVSNFEVNTPQHIDALAKFLDDFKILIVLASGIILFPLIRKSFIKRKLKLNFNFKKRYLYYILIGICISMVLNIIMVNIGLQTTNSSIKLASFFSVISTAIIGPIIEELIFRGIIYHKLKDNFSIKVSIILVSILFGLFHLNLIQGLYAIILSLIITIYYEKTNNLYVPILIHCFSNIAVSLLLPFVLVLKLVYINIIMVIFMLIGIYCLLKLKNKRTI